MESKIVMGNRNINERGTYDASEQNSLINSSVVTTLTIACCFKCGSFNQTGIFNLIANAIKSISFLCGTDSALCRKFLYSSSGMNSTNIAISLNSSLKSSLEIPVFFMICSEFFFVSLSDNSRAKNSKSWSTNMLLVKESFQKNVKSTLESTTNFIYINPLFFSSSYLPCLEALCSLTDQSVISLSSSKCLINLLTIRAIPNLSASFFNSSGILICISAISDNKDDDYLSFSMENDLVSFIMMPEEKENNSFVLFINPEFKNETLRNMNSSFTSQVMHKGLVVIRIENNFSYFVFNNLSQERIFFASFVNSSFASFFNNRSISRFSLNISETELNLMNLPSFNILFISLTCSGLGGNSSTGCQSICSQNSQSSSVTSPVCLYLSNMSFFINLITALANNSEFNPAKLLDLNNTSSIEKPNKRCYKKLSVISNPLANKNYLNTLILNLLNR